MLTIKSSTNIPPENGQQINPDTSGGTDTNHVASDVTRGASDVIAAVCEETDAVREYATKEETEAMNRPGDEAVSEVAVDNEKPASVNGMFP